MTEEAPDPETGSPSEAKSGFLRSHILNRAWVLLGAPSVAAVIAGVVLVKIGPWFVEPIDTLPNIERSETNAGIHFKQVMHVLNFSKRKVVDKDQMEKKVSPVEWKRYITAEKTGDAPTLYIQYGTTGLPLEIDTPSHKSRLFQSLSDDGKTRSYFVHVDIHGETPGKQFQVENKSVFWNAFQPGNTAAGFFVEDNADRLVMILEGDNDHVFEDVKFYVRELNSDARPKPYENPDKRITNRNTHVVWMVDKPRVSQTHIIAWRFKGDPK